jgi:hypothetical protein
MRTNPLLVTKLTRNAAQCRLCGDTVESNNTHDARSCSCGALIVDGGLSMIRRLKRHGAPPGSFEELSKAEALSVETVLSRIAVTKANPNPNQVATTEDIAEALQWISAQQSGTDSRR